MSTSSEQELRRQLEEPLSCECRKYPLPEDTALVTMLDTPYYPPYVHDVLHFHNCMEIGLCVAGSGTVRLHDRICRYSAGSVIVVPRGVYHNQSCEGDPLTHWRYIVVNEEVLYRFLTLQNHPAIPKLLESISHTGLFVEGSDESRIGQVFQLMYDLRRRDESDARFDLELCLLLLFSQIAHLVSSGTLDFPQKSLTDVQIRQPIEPALAYVYEHYKEDIQISELARCCSMSESYFRKVFQRIMHQPPLEYINRYRIHRAMNLLRTTSDPVQNIAVRSGFSSIAAFNRNFKQYAGVSPSAWRRDQTGK